jgi:undecaprenyl-diphosphatase
VLDAVNAFARSTGWLHAPVLAYARYGVALFALLLVLGWWLARGESARTRAAALWAPVATLVAVGVNQPLVHHFRETRPWAADPHLLVLADRSRDFSFPSDHATMAGAVAAGLLLVNRRLGVVAVVAALLMAVSRVYIAAHYPHDVVAGLALGVAVTVVGWAALSRFLTPLVRHLDTGPLGRVIGAGRPETAA